MNSNTSRPAPRANTGSAFLDAVSDLSTFLIHVERRIDPFVRPAFDAVLRDPMAKLTTALINSKRPNEGFALAEERPIRDEDAWLESIITSFGKQMRLLWKPGGFERGGNTKTHGIVRGEFIVPTPTFVTPDAKANAQLQIEGLKNAQLFYFINLHRPHLLDFIMQGLWTKTQSSPFEAPYFSCVPYQLGEDREAGGDPAEVEKLSAAMVGRTRAGQPLARIQKEPIPGIGPEAGEIRLNQFTFDRDPYGVECPVSAHVLRANPRTTDFPGRPTGLRGLVAALGFERKDFRDDLMSSVRFHRILRRGREYGPWLSPGDALQPAPPDDPERGGAA